MSERSKKIWAVGLSTLSLVAIFEAGRMTAAPLADPNKAAFVLRPDQNAPHNWQPKVNDPDVPADVVFLRDMFGMQQFKPGSATRPFTPPDDILEPYRVPAPPAQRQQQKKPLTITAADDSGVTYRM